MNIRAKLIPALTGGSNMKINGSSRASNGGDHINTAFVMLPTKLLADVATKRISEAAYTLYAFLKFWEGQNDHLWYGISTMAERTGFSQGKVKRLIKELLASGHIARRKKMGANWHTKCLTYVDKTSAVFVAGEKVHRQRPSASGASVEDSFGAQTAAFTEKPSFESRTPLAGQQNRDWWNSDTAFGYLDSNGRSVAVRFEEDELLS